MNFLFGCLLGFAVAAILERSALKTRTALLTAAIAGFAFLLATGFVGCAGSHEVIENGVATVIGDSGQVLTFKTSVVNHSVVLPVAVCLLASTTITLLSKRKPKSFRGV